MHLLGGLGNAGVWLNYPDDGFLPDGLQDTHSALLADLVEFSDNFSHIPVKLVFDSVLGPKSLRNYLLGKLDEIIFHFGPFYLYSRNKMWS